MREYIRRAKRSIHELKVKLGLKVRIQAGDVYRDTLFDEEFKIESVGRKTLQVDMIERYEEETYRTIHESALRQGIEFGLVEFVRDERGDHPRDFP